MTQTARLLSTEPVADLDAYRRAGGGGALHAALHRTPAGIIHAVERSGLRGRGGAGFPTGRKWRTVAANTSRRAPTTVVVNAAEGEPGTFKDRYLLRNDPYLVLEGALVATLAVGASEIVVGLKASFDHERRRLATAVDEARAAGWLEGVAVRIVEGPAEYLFGEETALLEVIEGRPPFPRVAPPYRRGLQPDHEPTGHSAAGLHLATPGGDDVAPTLVDNVETLANVALVLRHGADWFRSVGTEASPGTIVCTVTGDTVQHGVGEFAMGTPLREVIDALGGGVRTGREIAAVLPGVSSPAVGPDDLDTPLTYEAMAAIGSGLGSAGFIVVDDARDPQRVAAEVAQFLSVESCGQCEPCKRDGLAISTALGRADGYDAAEVADRLATVARGARCALAGQVERVVGSLVGGIAAPAGGRGPAGEAPPPAIVLPIVDIVAHQAVLDTTHLDKRPDWTMGGTDSGKWPAQLLADQDVEATGSPIAEAPPRQAGARVDSATADPSWADPLVASHRRVEDAVDALRAAAPGERDDAVRRLHQLLAHDLDLAQRFIYPEAVRLDPAEGPDLAWYPDAHEREALRLLDRLESAGDGASSRVVDELAADVHRYVIEMDRRILPWLTDRLDDAAKARFADALATADAEG